MILVVSTCADKLSEEEFVKPIVGIAGKCDVKHYTNVKDVSGYDKIIICGTALKDNEYLKNINGFLFLKETISPVLGICSGMQILCLLYGARITENKEIGMTKIKTLRENPLFSGNFEAYSLHGNGVDNLNELYVLAESEESVQAVKHKKKNLCGIMFHPEVRNEKIIRNFLDFA